MKWYTNRNSFINKNIQMNKTSTILKKYWNIIKNELNVKEVSELKNINVKKIFKPIWSKLSKKFWQDTGKIIANWKKWNAKILENWTLKVFDEQNERILQSNEFLISYEWLDENNMTAENNIIIKLNLNITEELEQEGIAREISRFLNQMRKEANLQVDKKINAFYYTENENLQKIITKFENFLEHEALLKSLNKKDKQPDGDIVSLFTYQDKTIVFSFIK